MPSRFSLCFKLFEARLESERPYDIDLCRERAFWLYNSKSEREKGKKKSGVHTHTHTYRDPEESDLWRSSWMPRNHLRSYIVTAALKREKEKDVDEEGRKKRGGTSSVREGRMTGRRRRRRAASLLLLLQGEWWVSAMSAGLVYASRFESALVATIAVVVFYF